jgi:hypothetical protein
LEKERIELLNRNSSVSAGTGDQRRFHRARRRKALHSSHFRNVADSSEADSSSSGSDCQKNLEPR